MLKTNPDFLSIMSIKKHTISPFQFNLASFLNFKVKKSFSKLKKALYKVLVL